MSAFISRIADRVETELNPEYVRIKNDMNNKANIGKIAAVALLVVGVAITLLGLSCASGGSALAVPVVLIGASMLYFGLNGYMMFNNLKELADNPKRVVSFGGFGSGIKWEDLKQHFKKNTIAFEWIVDPFVDGLKTQFNQRR